MQQETKIAFVQLNLVKGLPKRYCGAHTSGSNKHTNSQESYRNTTGVQAPDEKNRQKFKKLDRER